MDSKTAPQEAVTQVVIDQEALAKAGLTGPVRMVIEEGVIHIMPLDTAEALRSLEELAGSLGQEPAAAYDFRLKIGSLYEAR